MTDKNTLYQYRLEDAQATLIDAKLLFDADASPRSVINRAYYAMFYAVLSLFLKCDITLETSKHSGVISIFDKEFIRTNKITKEFSRMLHMAFDSRQEFDYKEFTTASPEMAEMAIRDAELFIEECCLFNAEQ